MPDYGLGSWPARRARITPDAVAFRQDERSLTYAALAARVDRLAGSLAARGIGRGDRIAYLGPNDITTFEVFFAAGRLGALFVPLNTRLADAEIGELLADCAPAAVFHAPGFPGDGFSTEDLPLDGPALPWEREVGLDDDAVILYSSGTTGRPKGAVLSHGNLTFNTMNQLAHTDVLASDVALCLCPLFHATGLGQVSLPTLFKGGTVVVLPKFDPAAVLGLVARHRVTSFSAVPTMLQMMCEHGDFPDADLSSLRFVVYGGSAVEERVALAWQRRGITLMQGYGMTEASPGVLMATGEGAACRPVSVGVPHFFTDVQVPAGELLVRGLNVFRGYWNRPAETERAFHDGWFRSGDVVRIGADGWGYVVDRVKDMFISGGENVYPAEVEAALLALDGVTEAAVVAAPDERWGETGHAHVVAEPGMWTEETLRAALRAKVAAFKVPRYVTFTAGLPKTATGKVRKQLLRRHPEEDTP